MYKRVYISVLLYLSVIASIAVVANAAAFTDPLLEAAVQLELMRLNAGNNVLQITSLNLRDLGISSLEGIEQLKNLESLDLRGNPVYDLTPLQGLVKLRSLNLRETAVSDLSPLATLKELRYLNIHSAPVEDISVIGSLQNLETLIMRNVYIGDQITVLRNLTKLQRLNIRNTGVTDLTILGELMKQGALQDVLALGIEAEVDIRDNPLPADVNNDAYAPVRPYWEKISLREPVVLPLVANQTVYINEVMTSNGGVLRDRAGDSPDWIELYNPANNDLDISGYYLSDDEADVTRWAFPPGTVIKAKSYLLVFASGKDYSGNGELHTNFSLKAEGEPLLLSDPDGVLIDFLPAVQIPRNVSFGRLPDGGMELLYFAVPTPNQANKQAGAYK